MSRRLDMASVALLPWQVPDLDGGKPAAHSSPPPTAAASAKPPIAAPEPRPETASLARLAEGHATGLERGLAEGREKGYAAGLEQGQRVAQQRLAEQARRLDAAIKTLGQPIRALERPVEDAVVALGLEVARRVIGGEIARSRDYLVRLIREAMAKVPIDMGAPKIILHPDDEALVRAISPDIESGGVTLVGDDSIEAGGCLVVADIAGNAPLRDKRWHPRGRDGASQVDLTLAARWRSVMLTLFDSEAE
jgi:flagellar assembly protein FliH